jgi:hypothetical protein
MMFFSVTHSFSLRAFGCNIQVATNSSDAYTVLKRYVFPSLPRAAKLDKVDLSIRIVRDGNQFQLLVDDVFVASASEPIHLVPDVIRALDDAVLPCLTTLRAVHAGTVVWDGRALLLPGISHAGKSALVAELLRRGATYFSDEYALIDLEGYVHPYPRPLLVRNGAPKQYPVLADECNASVGNAPAKVGWILALQYQPSSTWTVTPITQGEALLTLLRNTPHVLAETPDLVDVFQRAIAGAVCYTGHRSEAAHAVDEILRLINSLN